MYIIDLFQKEINTLNSNTFREAISQLQAIETLLEEEQREGSDKRLLEALKDDRNRLRSLTKGLFNPQFGSIFRTHHNPTYFSRRLFRYSDIYMSCLTDLLNYSVDHTFSPRRGALPHEKVSTRVTTE